MKQLVFNTDTAQTIEDSDSVGAFLRSSDGTLLTHTTVGGKEALDVNIVEGINVEVDLDAADDSVAAYLNDGAGNAISSTGGALHISDAGGSLTVDAVDLDIRDLDFASDSVDVSGSSVSITGDVNVTQGTSPWVVSATDLDIRDLAFATDSVTAHQGGTWVIDSITNDVTVVATDLDIRDLDAAQDSVQSNLFDGAGTALTSTLEGGKQALDVYVSNEIMVNDASLANVALANAAKTLAVANTAEEIVTTSLADRKYLFLHNNSNQEIYVGSSSVSPANGFPMPPKGYLELRLGAAVDLYFVGRTGATPEIKSLELA